MDCKMREQKRISANISENPQSIFIDHLPQPERAADECGFAEPDAGLALHWTNKCTHLNKNYFRDYTIKLLKQFHPKACPSCKSTDYRTIASRPTEVYCTSCRTHYSLTSGTPLDKYRLPLWTFGYLMKEAMDLHPQPLTIQCIKTKLKVGTKTATLLKRRLQLFTSEVRPAIEKMMVDGIRNEFPERFRLPSADKDITDIVQKKPVIYSDTVALFSASQRANGYRSRYKHNGQTSSIYLSDAVAEKKGKYQVGTLVHTISQKAYLVIFSSIPDQKQKTVMPLLDFLPKNAPHFSDEGFPYLHRINPNYRAINHSARAKNEKRNVWARDRWSHNGVHSQVAEGYQRALKTSMANYCYVRPEYSQLYLDEWSGLRALKLHGIEAVSKAKREVVGVSSTAMTTSTTTTDMGVYYYHPDHIGSASTVTDKSGKFTEHCEYFPYGEVWISESASTNITSLLPFKFTSKELDPETGLYYYGARYMDPRLGRFVSVDPPMVSGAYLPTGNHDKDANLPGMGGVFNSANLDLYEYAHGNPVLLVDPDGNAPKDGPSSVSGVSPRTGTCVRISYTPSKASEIYSLNGVKYEPGKGTGKTQPLGAIN